MSLLPHLSGQPATRRTGFTLVETTVAAAMLGMLMILIGRFLIRLEAAEASAVKRQTALRLVENKLERSAAEAHRHGRLPSLELSQEELETFPQGQLLVDRDDPDEAGASAVTVSLTWADRSGERTSPVSLTAWLFLDATENSSPEETP